MSSRVFYSSVRAVLFLLAPLLFIACGDGDGRLSRPEVEEIVREELADVPAPVQREPGLTSADVEEAIRAAMADMPQPVSGLSQEDVERVVEAAIASVPTPQPGLTSADVEDAIGAALAVMPQPEPGLTSAEAEKHRARRGRVHPAQVRPRRLHRVLRRERHQPLSRPRGSTPPSPITTGRRASTASGTCSSSTITTWSSGIPTPTAWGWT